MRILTIILLFATTSIYGQNILDYKFNGSEQGKDLLTVLEEISETENASFYTIDNWISNIQIDRSYSAQSLRVVLDQLFEGTEIDYISMYPRAVVIIKDPTKDKKRRESLVTALLEGKQVDTYKIGDSAPKIPIDVRLEGQVIDWTTGEPMSFTTVQLNDSLDVLTSDEEGRFVLELKSGAYVLSFNYVGYQDKVIDLLAYESGPLFVELEKETTELAEVVVEAERTEDLTNSKISRATLSVRDIKRAPSFLGEADLVKQVQTLPGVTTVGEAATGFNVRGGSVDQNLILYDGMPVFNSSHVFGFLISFNPEAVEDISFYKGGIPANYGGRISSVLDIKSKDGDFKEWKVNLGIGMITSNASVSGPIKEDTTSIAASIRTSYSNWLVHSVRTDYADLSNSKVNFYDATLKLAHKFTQDTKLSFTAYSSNDAFSLEGDTTYRWHNFQTSARLDHQFSPQLGADFTLGRSVYGYDLINNDPRQASELSYRIVTSSLNSNFHWDRDEHKVDFGWQLSHYLFKPGTLEPTSSQSNAARVSLENQYSLESALFINDEWTIGNRLTLEAGLRIPMFFTFGPGE